VSIQRSEIWIQTRTYDNQMSRAPLSASLLTLPTGIFCAWFNGRVGLGVGLG